MLMPESNTFEDSYAIQASPVPKETMVEAIFRAALEPSSDRSERDRNALVWTAKSLTDDVELERLVDAIPDLLWGPDYRRYSYDSCIRGLARHPDVQLVKRITSLLLTTRFDGVWSSSDHIGRRAIACYKALWAIASLSERGQSDTKALNFENVLKSSIFIGARNSDFAVYSTSARAIMQWSTFLAVEGRLIAARENLVACEGDELKGKPNSPKLEDVCDALSDMRITFYELDLPSTRGPHTISSLCSLIDTFLSEIPFRILLEFLCQASLDTPPYHLEETISSIQVSRPISGSLKATFESRAYTIVSNQIPRLNAASDGAEVARIDKCITELMLLLLPVDSYRTPAAITLLLNARTSDHALGILFLRSNIEIHLWESCVRTLRDGAKDLLQGQEEFTALWRLASIGLHYEALHDFPVRYACRESALKALSTAQSPLPFPLVTYSIIALLKVHALRFGKARNDGRGLTLARSRYIPP
ncbi:hypothetical protein MVEN_01739500 [Mycena venus]|uniref:Uncharacterized protein n=1 Tax=Mycena venus TaxID=2733690 RepID=A0A8H7CP23_9AGAR|nr:hypothetical protein MVEN_01739500 [Mycena venus]